MDRKSILAIAIGVWIVTALACGPVPSPTSVPPTARPTAEPTVAPTATTPSGGGGKGTQPTATPTSGGGEQGGGKGGGGAANRPAKLTLVNNANEEVCYVFISLSTEDTWGEDWLGETETIAPGDSREFEVTAGTYDLLALGCEGRDDVLDERYSVPIAGTLDWTVGSGSGAGVTVTLRNNSGETVCYVYISPSTSDTWGNDWLGSDMVAARESYNFQVSPGTYDFRAEDCDRNALDSQFGIALSSNWTWTIGPTEGGRSATLMVTNNTGTAIWYVYISPSTSDSWGDDWLGTDTIEPGTSYSFELTEGTYDMRAEDSEHNVMASRFGEYISGDMEWELYSEGGGLATVTLVNNSGKTVCYVYISLSTDTSWGSDWLGSSEMISSGSRRVFSLPVGTYDLRADDCQQNTLDSQYNVAISGGDYTWTIR